VVSPHLRSLGATLMPRAEFAALLRRACDPAKKFEDWPDSRLSAVEILASDGFPALQ
jgi:Leu/Phe-tRNA-protein transferase